MATPEGVKKRPVNMKDVAARAGVSRATVSLALRGDPSIPAATRERVRAAAEAAGYRPNPLISALMAQMHRHRPQNQSPVIAIVLQEALGSQADMGSRQIFSAFYEGATARAVALGYSVEYFSMHPGQMPASRLWRMLRARGIHGALFAPAPAIGPVDLEIGSFAAATIGYSIANPIHRATPHHFNGMWTACEELRRRGYRRIAYAQTRETEARLHYIYRSAYLGFHSTHPELCAAGIWDGGPNECDSLLSWLRRTRPDAVIVHQPQFWEWIREAFDVPGELALVELGARSRGDLGGIDQHHDLVGSAAIDLVVGQLNRNERGLPGSPKIIMIEGTWHEGLTVLPEAPQSVKSPRPSAKKRKA